MKRWWAGLFDAGKVDGFVKSRLSLFVILRLDPDNYPKNGLIYFTYAKVLYRKLQYKEQR